MVEPLTDVKGVLLHGLVEPRAATALLGDAYRGALLVTEARPGLEGARVTAPALLEHGYCPTLITDNMVAHCLFRQKIDAVVVAYLDGDDQVLNCARGALGIALSAAHHGVPVHAVRALQNAAGIEDIDSLETFLGHRVAPSGTVTYSPERDVVERRIFASIIPGKYPLSRTRSPS